MVAGSAAGGGRILDEVGNIHRHLLDLRIVERFNVLQRATIVNRPCTLR